LHGGDFLFRKHEKIRLKINISAWVAHISIDMGEFFVYSFFFGIMGLLFPVFVYFDSYLDVKENKCWFSVSFYKYFRFIGGYIQLTKDGMAIHLTKKTAFLVPYNQMADTRKKFEITKGFQLYSFR